MAGTVRKRNMPDQFKGLRTAWVVAVGTVFCFTSKRLETFRLFTLGTFEDFSIGIAESDGDVSDSFSSELDSVDS